MKSIVVFFFVALYMLGHGIRQEIRRENRLGWAQPNERPAAAG